MITLSLTQAELDKLVLATENWLDTCDGAEAVKKAYADAEERTSELECNEQVDAETLRLIITC